MAALAEQSRNEEHLPVIVFDTYNRIAWNPINPVDLFLCPYRRSSVWTAVDYLRRGELDQGLDRQTLVGLMAEQGYKTVMPIDRVMELIKAKLDPHLLGGSIISSCRTHIGNRWYRSFRGIEAEIHCQRGGAIENAERLIDWLIDTEKLAWSISKGGVLVN